MRSPHATTSWIAALIISSAAVAGSVFILEIATAPTSSLMIDSAILEAHVEQQPSRSDLSTEELFKEIFIAFVAFILITTPIIFLIALLPAFIVSSIWESSRKFPSILVYALGGLINGLAFSFLTLSPFSPFGFGPLTGPELTPLRFIFLGATAGLVGGLVFGWRRQAHFRLFLHSQKN